MNVRELYTSIKNSGKDFFITLIVDNKDKELFSGITNTEMLNFLKSERPFLYRYITTTYDEYFVENLASLSDEDVNDIYSPYIFVYRNDDTIDADISKELSDFSEDNTPYSYAEEELWRITIVILASHFTSMREYLEKEISRL